MIKYRLQWIILRYIYTILRNAGCFMKLKYLGVSFPHKKGEFCQKAKFPYYTICCFYTPFLYLENGKMVEGERGDIIINTPQQTVYHGPRYDSEEGFVNDWMHIDGEEIGLLLEKYPLPLNKAFHIDEWTSLRKYYNALLSEYNEKTAGSLDMIDCIMTQMIITMHRAYKKQSVLTKALDQISFVRQEIIKNPAKKWTLGEMAEMSGYSVSRFSELYRKAYNISPVNDVIEQRISSAKKLLLSGQVSVSQVADMCGFNSINYFSKFFKASTGYAPSEYIKYFMQQE